jgi:hypothetical protein
MESVCVREQANIEQPLFLVGWHFETEDGDIACFHNVVNFYQTTQGHILQDSVPHTYRRDSLNNSRFHKAILYVTERNDCNLTISFQSVSLTALRVHICIVFKIPVKIINVNTLQELTAPQGKV